MKHHNSNLRELHRKLKAFSNLNLSITPYSKISHIIHNEFPLPVTVSQIHAGQYVERIRINEKLIAYTNKEEISYIKKPEMIKTFGRANAPGKSMFYGSIMSSGVSQPMISALAETVIELQGENKGVTSRKLLMTVGKWKVKKDLILSELVFNKAAIEKCSDTERAYNIQCQYLATIYNDLPRKQMVAILEFYSDQFARRATKDTDYKISAAYTEQVCKMIGIQGVIYPSLQTEFEGTNVALTPQAVDSCLELEEVMMVTADIRNSKVFLNHHFRTGVLKPEQTTFGWGKSETVDKEVIEEYFLGNNGALEAWAEKRKKVAEDETDN